MRWTWDPDKNEINKRKHRISFETAVQVFDDPLFVMIEDSYPYERRWRTFGYVASSIIVVIHTWPEYDAAAGESVGRVISARRATRHERITYEEDRF